ncbi:MAG: stalk domain-containing protein [Candidatus Aquicultor sp.]|nr:stalk domain-containing protein [Candidatus Aquicultor sp.]
MKKLLVIIAMILVVSLLPTAVLAAPAPFKATATTQTSTELMFAVGETDYFVGDDIRSLDVAPFIREGRTLIPIRFLMEALGGEVSWDQVKNEVAITLQGKTIKLWINNAQAEVGGSSLPIDSTNAKVVPIIEKSRTFIPLRFVMEAIDSEVVWEPVEKIITVRYPKPALIIHDGNGYRISYPENWVLADGSFVGFTSPEGNNANVGFEDLSADPKTLDEYTALSLATLKEVFPDIKILESASTTLGGNTAYKVTYTATQLGSKMKIMQIWTIKNNKAYIVTYGAVEGLYSNYADTTKRMLDSFTFE